MDNFLPLGDSPEAKQSREHTFWMRQGNKQPITFEGMYAACSYFYRVITWGIPRKGDFYLSGNPVGAWRAPSDLSTPFWIVAPTFRAKRVQAWQKGEPVKRDSFTGEFI